MLSNYKMALEAAKKELVLELVLRFDDKTVKKINAKFEYEQENSRRRWIIGACVGDVTPSLLAEMKAYVSFMRENQHEPDIYIEEQDSQSKDQWGLEIEKVLSGLYPDQEKRRQKVQSIYVMRLDPEWIKLHSMLMYLLEGSANGQLIDLTEQEKTKLSKQESRDDLLALLEKEVKRFVKNRQLEGVMIGSLTEEALQESRHHFIKSAVDHLYWMSKLDPDRKKGSQSRLGADSVLLHRHCRPSFVERVMHYANYFGRNKYSLDAVSMAFEEVEIGQCLAVGGLVELELPSQESLVEDQQAVNDADCLGVSKIGYYDNASLLEMKFKIEEISEKGLITNPQAIDEAACSGASTTSTSPEGGGMLVGIKRWSAMGVNSLCKGEEAERKMTSTEGGDGVIRANSSPQQEEGKGSRGSLEQHMAELTQQVKEMAKQQAAVVQQMAAVQQAAAEQQRVAAAHQAAAAEQAASTLQQVVEVLAAMKSKAARKHRIRQRSPSGARLFDKGITSSSSSSSGSSEHSSESSFDESPSRIALGSHS